MGGLGGGAQPIPVGSLGAGGDKGETGWHLPLSLIGGLVVVSCFCVASVCCFCWLLSVVAAVVVVSLLSAVLCYLSCLVSSSLVLSGLVLPCLCSCLALCFVVSSLVLSCLVFSYLVLSCLVSSCLVVSRLVLFLSFSCLCLALSCLVLSCSSSCRFVVLSCLVVSCLVCLVLCCFGRLEVRLASFLVVLGVVLGDFWSSWGCFWPSWGVLGASWGRLGGLFGALGRSWAVLRALHGPNPTKGQIMPGRGSVFGPSWPPKMTPRRPHDDTLAPQSAPRGGQGGAQDDQKSIQKFLQKTIPSWNDLKTVLGRSWADLGPVLGSKCAKNHGKTYGFVNIDVFDKIPS